MMCTKDLASFANPYVHMSHFLSFLLLYFCLVVEKLKEPRLFRGSSLVSVLLVHHVPSKPNHLGLYSSEFDLISWVAFGQIVIPHP